MAGTGKAHLRDGDVVLRIEDLVMEFPVGRTGLKVNAVSGISFDVLRGETLGLVGESGCGKSTTGRAVMQLPRPTSGSVVFEGQELTALQGADMREARTKMQIIFQDPISSLNPPSGPPWSTPCSKTSASTRPAPPRARRTSSRAASASASRSHDRWCSTPR
jgi:peptide/nickel transport system ATP-binding protein